MPDRLMMHCSVCGAPMISKLSLEEIAKIGLECQFCYSTITRPIMRKALRIDDEEAPVPEVKVKAEVPPIKPTVAPKKKLQIQAVPTFPSIGSLSPSSKKKAVVKRQVPRKRKKSQKVKKSSKKTKKSSAVAKSRNR